MLMRPAALLPILVFTCFSGAPPLAAGITFCLNQILSGSHLQERAHNKQIQLHALLCIIVIADQPYSPMVSAKSKSNQYSSVASYSALWILNTSYFELTEC